MVKGSGQRAKEVERVVAEYERSGMSRRVYSERYGIPIPTLDWYRRRIRASRTAANVVPVVVEKPASVADTGGDARGFALVPANGRRIEAGWNFIALAPVDMRKGFEGLHGLLRDHLGDDPLSGHLFLFANRARTGLKALVWDGSGLWDCAKRPERHSFHWPKPQEQSKRTTTMATDAIRRGG